jgi:hypothetical protein
MHAELQALESFAGRQAARRFRDSQPSYRCGANRASIEVELNRPPT